MAFQDNWHAAVNVLEGAVRLSRDHACREDSERLVNIPDSGDRERLKSEKV